MERDKVRANNSLEIRMKVADFFCYGGIGTGKGQISALMVSNFISSLNKSVEEIRVHIISNGGDVFQGYAIHDLFRNSGRKITTIAEGLVASSGTIVFSAGDEREMLPNAQLMFHLPFIIDPEGEFRSDDLAALSSEMKDAEQKIKSFYAKKTGLEDSVIESITAKDTFISADKAIELKFATRISEPMKAVAYLNPTTKQNDTMSKETWAQRIEAAYKILKGETVTPPAIVAASQTTSDGAKIYFEGTLAEGTKVFTDEAMSMPCADGSMTMEDGSTLVVTGGSVTSIEAKVSVDPAVATLTEENATLKAEVEKLTLEVQAKAAEKLQMETEGGKVIAELTEKVRTQVLAEVKSKFTPKVSGEQFKPEFKALTDAERKAEIERIRNGKKTN